MLWLSESLGVLWEMAEVVRRRGASGLIIFFEPNTDVSRARKLLNAAGIKTKMLPPEAISKGSALAFELSADGDGKLLVSSRCGLDDYAAAAFCMRDRIARRHDGRRASKSRILGYSVNQLVERMRRIAFRRL